MDELDDLLDPGVKQTNTNNTGGGTGVLKNANGILALGIISIAVCWLYAIPGLVCGIIALALFKGTKAQYLSDPAKYEASYKNAKAGYICAIIGTSLSALYFLFIIFIVVGVVSGSRW